MRRQQVVSALQLRVLLLLLLLATASCIGFGRQKPRKDASKEGKSKPVTAHKLPPSTFVRIFALPSFEGKVAQHRLGELLAAACKNHARVGGCKLYSASLGAQHVRVLQFSEEGNNKTSVIAYMLQENEEDIERALQVCADKHEDKAATQENGKDYRCFSEKAKMPPSRVEVLGELREQLEKIGVYEELDKAVHKSIFLSADLKQIIYHESQRLVGDNGDQDFFLQTIRDSFRRIVEWLSWQFQHFSSLSEGTPILYSHAEDLDSNEKEEIERILEFLDIEDLHVVEETVTATRGEIKFQKERLRAAILSLPKALMADIDEFMVETLQDKRILGRYVRSPAANRTALWPPPTVLQHLAIDNTILVTAATCSYAPLVVNWIKHVHTLGIPCYLVVALDDELYRFLHNWLPEHVVRAPEGFVPAVPRQYAAPGTPAMRHVSRARLATLRAITEQGYHAAWSDADIALTQNVFTIFSRWFDLVATWAGGSSDPLDQIEKVVGYELKFSKDDPDRKVSPSFLFLRGSESSRQFLDKWWEAANSSHSTEDGAVLNELLHNPAVNSALSIQLLPESIFPSGSNLFSNASAAYQKKWEKMPPAWAHADSAKDKEGKIELLASGQFWKVVEEDPMPQCARPTEDYLTDGTAVPLWPPPEILNEIAQDDTIFVTSATCAYADLLTNWIKHVWDLQIKCFFVAAADEPTAKFLSNWVPEHVDRIPVALVNTVKKFAQKETPEYTKVLQSKPRVLRAILAQGLNAAWSDADISWTRNPFVLFDKSPDLVVAWADNSKVTPGGVLKPGSFPGEDNGQKIGSAFLFIKPSSTTLKLVDRWIAKLSKGSSYVDDAAALQELLLDKEFHSRLAIGVFPSAMFPTGSELTEKASQPEALKEAWEDAGSKPAWVHADSSVSHDGKVKLLKGQQRWRVEANDPQPKCKTWGRKLGDSSDDVSSDDVSSEEDLPLPQSAPSHVTVASEGEGPRSTHAHHHRRQPEP